MKSHRFQSRTDKKPIERRKTSFLKDFCWNWKLYIPEINSENLLKFLDAFPEKWNNMSYKILRNFIASASAFNLPTSLSSKLLGNGSLLATLCIYDELYLFSIKLRKLSCWVEWDDSHRKEPAPFRVNWLAFTLTHVTET